MYTTIIHPIRKALSLSVNEYCVLDAVYRLSQNVKYNGWCVMSKKHLAEDLDLSERTVFDILETLKEKDLIDKNHLGHVRTKDTWNELMANSHDYYIAFNGKESQFISGRPIEPQTAKIADPYAKIADPYAKNAEGMQKVHSTYAETADEGMQKLQTTYAESSYNNNKTIISNNKIDNKSSRFAPPSLLEIQNYCKERNNSVDAESFWSFYESKGWRVGSQPMKSWQAAIITWEKRQSTGDRPSSGKIYKHNGREISKEEFDRIKN